jgi:membrane associated rhomboid family serine protease
VTVGASGAVFGLMGAGVVALRARGFDPMQSGLGVTLLLNLAITFLIPGISIGGHVGGLIGGGLCALAFSSFRRTPAVATLSMIAVGVASVGLALMQVA